MHIYLDTSILVFSTRVRQTVPRESPVTHKRLRIETKSDSFGLLKIPLKDTRFGVCVYVCDSLELYHILNSINTQSTHCLKFN